MKEEQTSYCKVCEMKGRGKILADELHTCGLSPQVEQGKECPICKTKDLTDGNYCLEDGIFVEQGKVIHTNDEDCKLGLHNMCYETNPQTEKWEEELFAIIKNHEFEEDCLDGEVNCQIWLALKNKVRTLLQAQREERDKEIMRWAEEYLDSPHVSRLDFLEAFQAKLKSLKLCSQNTKREIE